MAHGKNKNHGWVNSAPFTFEVSLLPSNDDLSQSENHDVTVPIGLDDGSDLVGYVTGQNTMEPGKRYIGFETIDGDEWVLSREADGQWIARNNTAMREVYEPRIAARRRR